MKKIFFLTCFIVFVSLTSFALSPITGTFGCCIGGSNYVSVDSASSAGGIWSSSNVVIATVSGTGSHAANVYGVSAGVVTITYTLGASYVTASFTVAPTPAAITGTMSFCNTTPTTLSDATAGGYWSTSYGSYVATVNSATGLVTGIMEGTEEISYNIIPGCRVSALVTINVTPTGYISGPYSVCTGSAFTLTDFVPGGIWSSSSAAIATIDATTGVAVGLSAGTVNFTYTVSGVCGTASTRDTVIVHSTTVPATLSGPSTVAEGSSITLLPSIYGGTWSSSNASVATVNTAGAVTGVTPGTSTISYSVSGCTGVVATTTDITVVPFNGISGHVIFGSGSHATPVRVWLITFNPSTSDLEAIDSVTIHSGSLSVYYEFPGIATDSYRIKATVSYDTSYAATGYIPTYHTSSYYWHDADVVYHTSGGSDINKDINMATGLVTPGPGFIGGNVMTGANRGTSGSVPVKGLLMFLQNTATGSIVQQTYTDAAGTYTFSSLPYGNYFVYPELINYGTIPYSSINLTSTNPSKSAANFIQHTISHTITPANVGVGQINTAAAYALAFPNPTSGKLNIMWQETAKETSVISIADMAGKEVYTTKLLMNEGTGMKQIDLSAIANGTYLITVKSENINYSGKVQVIR